MILLKKIFFSNFYKNYRDFKFKQYKEENIDLTFLNLEVQTNLFNETSFCIFINFNSININNFYYQTNYNVIVVGYFLNNLKNKTLVSFTLDDDDNYNYNLKNLNDNNTLEIDSIMLSNFEFNDNYIYTESKLKAELISYSEKFFNILFKKLEVIGLAIEKSYFINNNPGFIFYENKYNKFKLNIYICNSRIKDFPFWAFTYNLFDYKLKLFYTKSTNNFSKLSFKNNNSWISFINYIENFYYKPVLEVNSYINYDSYKKFNAQSLDFEKFVLLNYYNDWCSMVLFFNKNIIINNKKNSFKRQSLSQFNSIKSYGWFLFNYYLLNNNFVFRDKYTLEEYDVFTSSLFLGIQTIDNYNDTDLINIKHNLNNINSWDDFNLFTKNTLLLSEYDINAAFSYSASKSQFSNNGYFCDVKDIIELENKNGFVFVTIEDFDELNNYYIPIRDLFSKQVYYNCYGHLYGWFLIEEVLQLKDYCKINLFYAYYFNENRFYLKNFIESIKNTETVSVRNKNLIKIILNSIYGMFNYKDRKVNININIDNNNFIKKKVFKKINLTDNTNLTLVEDDVLNKSKYFFISPIINAHNRITLRNYLFDIKKKNGIIGLINIDSFWTNLKLPINSSEIMGELKIKNSEKKIIFINQNSYINFTDNYLMYNNRKITDISKVKNILNNQPIKRNLNKKIKIDFIECFEKYSNIKKYIVKPTVDVYNKLNDNLKTSLSLNDTYSYFKKILDYIDNSYKSKDNFGIKEKFNIHDDVKFTIGLYLYIDSTIIKQFFYEVYMKTKNNEKEMFKLYQKFDNIIYNWFENYVEDYYVIELTIIYTFDNKESLPFSIVLKGSKE